MRTDIGDDKVVELDWDRLVSWFAGLCRSERASDCLPAALYHPDLLPAVRSMTSSLPAAREVLSRWQPSALSPEQKILRKMVGFATDGVETLVKNLKKNPDLPADLAEKVSSSAGEFVRAGRNVPNDLVTDLPIATLQRVDQIIDDPTLSLGGKCTAIVQVLRQGAAGKVVSH